MAKNNPPYGKKKINEFQRILKEVQTDSHRTQKKTLEVPTKLEDASKDEEEYWYLKGRTCGTHLRIFILNFIMH